MDWEMWGKVPISPLTMVTLGLRAEEKREEQRTRVYRARQSAAGYVMLQFLQGENIHVQLEKLTIKCKNG